MSHVFGCSGFTPAFDHVAVDVRIGIEKRGKRKLKVGVDIPSPQEIKQLLGSVSGRLRPKCP
jgi:hypothetical protein